MRYYSVSFNKKIVWMYNEKSSDGKRNDAIEADKDGEAAAIEQLKNDIDAIPGVKKSEVADGGHIVGIEAFEESYSDILNKVVNMFRRFDDSSIVTYDFQLNV